MTTTEMASISLVSVAAVTALAVLALVWLGLSLRRSYAQWQRRRRWSRAEGAEARAPLLLERLGYAVLGGQVQRTYTLQVDGRPIAVSVRADYVVSRGGRHYVAEVKSGKFAPSLDTPATRRQLLEYLVAFQVDGVLLVDGETRRVHEVVFPRPADTTLGAAPAMRLGWIMVLLATVAALIWVSRVG